MLFDVNIITLTIYICILKANSGTKQYNFSTGGMQRIFYLTGQS